MHFKQSTQLFRQLPFESTVQSGSSSSPLELGFTFVGTDDTGEALEGGLIDTGNCVDKIQDAAKSKSSEYQKGFNFLEEDSWEFLDAEGKDMNTGSGPFSDDR